MIKSVLSIGMLCFVLLSVAQGWNQPKNQGYFQLSEKFYSTNKFFNEESESIDLGGTMASFNTELYGEYGFSDRLMGVLKLPIVYNTFSFEDENANKQNEDERSKFGLGEIELGVAYAILKDQDLVLNTYFFQTIPLGDAETDLGIRTSDNEASQKLLLGIGYSGFYPVYINGSIGFANRNNNYSDAIIHNWNIGYKIKEKFIIAIKVFGEHSLNNGDDEIKNAWYANNVGYLAYGP